ncbi:hypothetical protein PAXRUDRAFT_766585, partial [Paxillus rubicundulus Ve08.2h10]
MDQWQLGVGVWIPCLPFILTNTGCTSKMVKWLVGHPIDCVVLFLEDRSAPCPEGWASGRTKLEICTVIAGLIFKDDKDYVPWFATRAAKFAKGIQDHLGMWFKRSFHGILIFTVSGGASPHTPQRLSSTLHL